MKNISIAKLCGKYERKKEKKTKNDDEILEIDFTRSK